MPLAASREPRVRFLLGLSGPAMTADEVDPYQALAGEGHSPPRATAEEVHALVDTATGLTAEMLRSRRFAPGLSPKVAARLRAHRIGRRRL